MNSTLNQALQRILGTIDMPLIDFIQPFKKCVQIGLACSAVFVCAHAKAAPCSSSSFAFSICDEFSGSSVDQSVWTVMSTAGEGRLGSTVSVHDGILDLAMDRTDDGGQVKATLTALDRIRVSLRYNLHPGGSYFIPGIYLGGADGAVQISLRWVRSQYPPDYCDGYGSGGGNDRVLLHTDHRDGDRCNNIQRSSVTASTFFDRWSNAVVDYDSNTGIATADIDDDGTIDLQATVPAAKRAAIAYITLSPFGWWTGHRFQFDSIRIEGTPSAPAVTRTLNDTGITWSGHATNGNASNCEPTHPAGQDCHYGRDAAAAAGQLVKRGGGSAGFDFTKISNSGAELPASAALGSGANEWACTKDNVTGLVWEVKTNSGLRSQSHTYSWFNTQSPDGNKGTESGGTCATAGRCDTEKFVADVNAAGLCGASNWRMPTIDELVGIVHMGRMNPAIDSEYFPNTAPSYFWSNSVFSGQSQDSWITHFTMGNTANYRRYVDSRVRLVRASY